MTHQPEHVFPSDDRTERHWRELKAQLRHEASLGGDVYQRAAFDYTASTALERHSLQEEASE